MQSPPGAGAPGKARSPHHASAQPCFSHSCLWQEQQSEKVSLGSLHRLGKLGREKKGECADMEAEAWASPFTSKCD